MHQAFNAQKATVVSCTMYNSRTLNDHTVSNFRTILVAHACANRVIFSGHTLTLHYTFNCPILWMSLALISIHYRAMSQVYAVVSYAEHY